MAGPWEKYQTAPQAEETGPWSKYGANPPAPAPGPTVEAAAKDPQARTNMLRQQHAELPWYGQIGQALDDVARFGLDTASFGGADKLASMLPGGGTIQEERQKTADARARSRGASTALDVAQALKSPQILGKTGLFGLGADAALYSGAQSYGHGSTLKEAGQDALLGGGMALGMGGLAPVLRGVAQPLARTSPLRGPMQAMGHLTHTTTHPTTGIPVLAGSLTADAADRLLRSRAGLSAEQLLKLGARTVPVSPTFRREDNDHGIRR